MTRGVPVIPIGRGAGKDVVTATGQALVDLPPSALITIDRRDWVRKIEAAARAEVIAEIRAGVEGLPRFYLGVEGDEPLTASMLDRAAVLALLPPTEPK